MVFGLSVLNRVYNLCESVLNRVWSVRLSLLNVAYTLFSNLRFGAFAGLGNTLKLCRTRECVCCHLC